MQQRASKYLIRRRIPHPPTLRWSNSTFSEHGHVAYQIKRNRAQSTMQAHILTLHTPSTFD